MNGLNLLDRAAIEMLAKSMLEYKYRNHTDGSDWINAGEKTRNSYRRLAYNYLHEGF